MNEIVDDEQQPDTEKVNPECEVKEENAVHRRLAAIVPRPALSNRERQRRNDRRGNQGRRWIEDAAPELVGEKNGE